MTESARRRWRIASARGTSDEDSKLSRYRHERLRQGAALNGQTPRHGDRAATRAESAREVFRRLTERPADLLRFATAGSVDDGKSTLIGRLLYDSKQVLTDQLEHVEQASQRMGHDFLDLSLLTDGLRAEREQGITIDVAYRYFATAQRRFIIADTPGHEQYTRNMVTGASTADLAIVLVDARKGVIAQSKRHAFISSLLGIPHVVVCVNKMDLVDYDEDVFDAIVEDFDTFAARLEMPDVTFIPISALLGDNVVERSETMPWYQGPPLLYHLEHVHIASDRNLIDVRFPVQWVIRPPSTSVADYRAYAGQVAGGVIRPGRRGGGAARRAAQHDRRDRHLRRSGRGGLPADVGRAAAGGRHRRRARQHDRAHPEPADGLQQLRGACSAGCPSSRWIATGATRSSTPRARRWSEGSTSATGSTSRACTATRAATTLELNDLGRVRLELSAPLVFDSYRRNRTTGSLIVIDEATNETVAAGVILDTEVEDATDEPRASAARTCAGRARA